MAQTDLKEFIPMSLESVTADNVLGFDLYRPGPDKPVLFRNKNISLTQEDVERSKEMGFDYFLVPQKQRYMLYDHLCETLTDAMNDDSTPIKAKYQVMTQTTSLMLKDVYENPELPEGIRYLMRQAEHHVHLAMTGEDAQYALISGKIDSTPMISHAIHVSNLSVLVALGCGISEPKELFEISLGALLHEVGKVLIDKHIFDNSRSTRKVSNRRLKNYPSLGKQVLSDLNIVPHDSITTVNEHQERLDGSGFPDNLVQHEISLHAKIVGVCDFYDETIRFSENNITPRPFNVLMHLRDNPEKFDRKISVELIRVMANSV